jgi:hypothetical protein
MSHYTAEAIKEFKEIQGIPPSRQRAPTVGVRGGSPTAGDRKGEYQARFDAAFDAVATNDEG